MDKFEPTESGAGHPPPTACPFPTARTLFDPPDEMRRLRETGRLGRLSYPDGEVGWLTTEYDTGREILSDPRFSIKGPGGTALLVVPPPQLDEETARSFTYRGAEPVTRHGDVLGMDAPEHTDYRRRLAGRMSARAVARIAPDIERFVAARLQAMALAGPGVDFASTFALPLTLETISRFLGVPNRPEWHAMLALMEEEETLLPELAAAGAAMSRALQEEFVRIKDVGGTGLLPDLIASETDLTDDEILGTAGLLIIAGHHTTSSIMPLGLIMLTQHRTWWDALVLEPERAGDIVEEIIRYFSVLHHGTLPRTALDDVEVGGETIRAGERVNVAIAGANRDPAAFADPDVFDPDRSAWGHLAFGYGVHQCLGQHLARLELRIAYTRLRERFPDLRPAVRLDELRLHSPRHDAHGVRELPVTWGGS